MFVFCLLDNRLHKFSHGWQTSRKIFTENIIKLLNDKSASIEFPYYNAKGETESELLSFQPIIYYILIIGSIVSFFIFK
jgi:hypothetical protein